MLSEHQMALITSGYARSVRARRARPAGQRRRPTADRRAQAVLDQGPAARPAAAGQRHRSDIETPMNRNAPFHRLYLRCRLLKRGARFFGAGGVWSVPHAGAGRGGRDHRSGARAARAGAGRPAWAAGIYIYISHWPYRAWSRCLFRLQDAGLSLAGVPPPLSSHRRCLSRATPCSTTRTTRRSSGAGTASPLDCLPTALVTASMTALSRTPQHGLSSNKMALITPGCGSMCSLSIKWP